jgi:hypothetical protein
MKIKPKPTPSGITAPRYQGKEIIVWAGHLARERNSSQMGNADDLPPLLVESSPEMALFRKLQHEHSQLPDRGILVLNLCGARDQWTKIAAAPLCHFFLHMNYTGPAGSSAVVLWNVPIGAADVFEKGIELARRAYGNLSDKANGNGDVLQNEATELVRKSYKHLKDLHRVALLIYDNGEARLVCGSDDMEKLLNRFAHVERLTLDDLAANGLSNEKRLELDRLIATNTHIFHRFKSGEVGLLAWRHDLRGRVWSNDMAWLENVLSKDVTKHGVQRHSGKAFYRLPSSGLLVKTFYSFTSFLCNWENCARLAWMLHELILEIEKLQSAKVQWLVAVTRSASPLAQHLYDNYLKPRGANAPQPLFASTVEDLERQANERQATGTAIFVTDVISTGTLSARVGRAMKSLKWLGTVSILDTRSQVTKKQVVENAGPAQGISYIKADGLRTGAAFILKHRPILKLDPLEHNPHNTPAGLSQSEIHAPITRFVCGEFFYPKCTIADRHIRMSWASYRTLRGNCSSCGLIF